MTGKTCLVTGANSGIGKETAIGLARMGARVLLVCRNQKKGEDARADIERETGSSRLDLLIADMSSFGSVRALAAQVRQRYSRLDVLINNAGAAVPSRTLSADGIEMTVAGNYLGAALLTFLLLDLLKSSAPSRIVNVSSAAPLYPPAAVNSAYGTSKAALNQMTRHLAAELEGTGVTANVMHPGSLKTEMWADMKRRIADAGAGGEGHADWIDMVERTGGDSTDRAIELVLELLGEEGAETNGRFCWPAGIVEEPLPSW